MNTFQNKLFELRKQKNYTQEDLANKLHVSRQAISKWENGVSYPSMDILTSISKVFNVSIDDLFNQDDVRNITFKNNNKLKKIKLITMIMGFIGLVILSVSIISLIRANEAVKLNKAVVEVVEKDYQVGIIIITAESSGEEDVDLNNISTSGYAYYINNIDDVNQEKSKGLFNVTKYGSKKVSASIFIDNNKANYVMIASVYKKPDNNLYIKNDHYTKVNNIGKLSLKTEENNNPKEINFEIEIFMVNSLDSVKLTAYDINHNIIEEKDIDETIKTYKLPIDCLYVVIENKYKNDSNESYYVRDVLTSGEIGTSYFYVINYSNEKGVVMNGFQLSPMTFSE